MRGAWFLRDWVRGLQKYLLRETEADLREPPKSHFSYLSISYLGRSLSRLNCLDLTSAPLRSEEHTSELQSHSDLVCRLLLEKKKISTEETLCRLGADKLPSDN